MQNILVIRKQAIGDVLMTTPFLEVLRREYPQAKIIYLTNEWSKIAIENNPFINDLIIYKNNEFFNFFKFWQNPFKKIYHILAMRRKKFDALFVLQSPSVFWGLFGIFIGARTRVGLSVGKPDFLTDRILIKRRSSPLQKYVYDSKHKIEWNLKLLKVLGVKNLDNNGEFLSISKKNKEIVEKFWQVNSLANKIVLSIAPGGGTNPNMRQYCKRWPRDYWVKFLQGLNYVNNLAVALIGGKSDKEILDFLKKKIQDKVNYKIIDTAGQFSLAESAEIIKRSKLFIGTDGGPMHLANCVKTPMVVIFGPTDPSVYGPYQIKAEIIDKKLPCKYCYKEECWHLLCMRKVGVEEVLTKVQKIILQT